MGMPWGSRLLLFGAALGWGGFGPTLPAEPVPENRSPAPSLDAQAAQVVAAAGSFYLGLQSFQADGASVQRYGRAAETHEDAGTFSVAMARPASFAFERKTAGLEGLLVSDGETLTTCLPRGKAFLSRPAPADVSQMIHPSTDHDLDIRVVGSYAVFQALLSSHPFQNLTKKMSGAYLGSERIGETATDHLRFTEAQSTKTRTLDLWFAQGAAPFLVQARQAYTAIFLPGVLAAPLPDGWSVPHGEDTLTFSNWRFNESVPSERFRFQPSPGMVPVADLSTVRPIPVPPEAGSAPPDPGAMLEKMKAANAQAKIRGEGMELEKLWQKERADAGEN